MTSFEIVKNKKMKRKTLCRPLEEGRLNIIDVNVFIERLKVTKIRRLLKKDKCWWMASLKEDVLDLDLQKYCGSRVLFSERNIVNSFWHDVFSSFTKISERCVPSTIQ